MMNINAFQLDFIASLFMTRSSEVLCLQVDSRKSLRGAFLYLNIRI